MTPFLKNRIITFKTPLFSEAQTNGVITLLQNVSLMCFDVRAEAVNQGHLIISPRLRGPFAQDKNRYLSIDVLTSIRERKIRRDIR